MIIRVVVMGFATVHKTYLTPEWSPSFSEIIDELYRYRDTNYIYDGSVNTGDDESRRRNTVSPVKTTLSYSGDFQNINQRYRKQMTQKVKSSLNEWTWPTVILVFDENRHLIGMIKIPEGSWSSVRSDVMKNLSFFLRPFGENFSSSSIDKVSGLRAPNSDIIEIDFSSWRKELSYEIEKEMKKIIEVDFTKRQRDADLQKAA